MVCDQLHVCVHLRFGGDQPVYINIIRDPVNRFLSNYFFRRFGDWRGEQNHMIRTPSMRQEERYLVSPVASNMWSPPPRGHLVLELHVMRALLQEAGFCQ